MEKKEMSEYKIQVKNLHKAFGKKVVLDGVDIEIKKANLWLSSAVPEPANRF